LISSLKFIYNTSSLILWSLITILDLNIMCSQTVHKLVSYMYQKGEYVINIYFYSFTHAYGRIFLCLFVFYLLASGCKWDRLSIMLFIFTIGHKRSIFTAVKRLHSCTCVFSSSNDLHLVNIAALLCRTIIRCQSVRFGSTWNDCGESPRLKSTIV
jgi:hypothetical protein